MTDVVEQGALGKLGSRLGAGAQAEIFDAPKVRLPDIAGPLVYKRYKNTALAPPSLSKIVGFRRQLDAKEQATLGSLATWPLRMVAENDEVRGVLLQRIPDAYGHERALPGSGTKKRCLQEIQNLFIDPMLAARLTIPLPKPSDRLALCRDFARALHFLHRRDVVFGDINAKNAVYRLGSPPSMMLVDCDAVRFRGSISKQLNAPDWNPPEGEVLTLETDRYKFGLFVLRCLAPGPQASTGRDPRRASRSLDAEGLSLLTRSLAAAPTGRPTIQEWGHYLHWRITGTRISAPAGSASLAAAAASAAPGAGTPLSPSSPRSPTPTKGLQRDASGRWVPVT